MIKSHLNVKKHLFINSPKTQKLCMLTAIKPSNQVVDYGSSVITADLSTAYPLISHLFVTPVKLRLANSQDAE